MVTQPVHMTDSDRISRLEGQVQYLATKADVERLGTRIEQLGTRVEALRAELREDMMRMFLIAIGVNIGVVSAGIAFLRLTGGA